MTAISFMKLGLNIKSEVGSIVFKYAFYLGTCEDAHLMLEEESTVCSNILVTFLISLGIGMWM